MTEFTNLDHKEIKRILTDAAKLSGDQKRSAFEELAKTIFKDHDILAEAKTEQENETELFNQEIQELLKTLEGVQDFETDYDDDKYYLDIVYNSGEDCVNYASVILSKIAAIEEKYGYEFDVNVIHKFAEGADYKAEVGATLLKPSTEELSFVIKQGLKNQMDLDQAFSAIEEKLFKTEDAGNKPEGSIYEHLEQAIPDSLSQYMELEKGSKVQNDNSFQVYINTMRAVRAVSGFLDRESKRLSALFKEDVTLWVSVIEEA